ncbi:MAG: DUF2855 family protein [Pseudomonadota bacterium]
MTTIATFQVNRTALDKGRVVSDAPAPLRDGQVHCAVDRFGLSANNVTYGVAGDIIGYWHFFPAEAPWGVIPVWGFADVVDSRHADVAVGERLYGYWPMGSHLVLEPGKVSSTRLVDGTAHRAVLPPVYNSYARCSHEPHYDAALDDARMLLFPLYATSFCLYDHLVDNGWFGAQQVIVPCASSRTAIGLAYALADDREAPPAVGLTSPGNLERVTALGLYDRVVAYDGLDAVSGDVPGVIVDMSGNGEVLASLHARLGENMRFTLKVGLTHHDKSATGKGYIDERSRMFFAPKHIAKRAEDWGPGEFDKRAFAFWQDAARRSERWLSYEHGAGMAAVEQSWRRLLEASVPPTTGLILSPGA